MNKRDALRLKPGDNILFSDVPTRRMNDATNWFFGEVLHITPKGGVRVRITESRDGCWNGPGTGASAGKVRWIPYHHVFSKQP